MANPLIETVLSYYNDIGIDSLSENTPLSKIHSLKTAEKQLSEPKNDAISHKTSTLSTQDNKKTPAAEIETNADLYKKAVELAANAKDLEDLSAKIQEFEGISYKNMCTNMVFSDGHPESKIMVIGEAPGADEDKIGKPFVGMAGQLLDRMFSAIDFDRAQQSPENSIYISNILNWRPPGNRTPTEQEVNLSLPFIERHISLIQPKVIVLMGAVSGKALLKKNEGISKFRGKWHDYTPQTPEIHDLMPDTPIKAIATFHPAYLLRQSEKKKESWQDLQEIKKHLSSSS